MLLLTITFSFLHGQNVDVKKLIHSYNLDPERARISVNSLALIDRKNWDNVDLLLFDYYQCIIDSEWCENLDFVHPNVELNISTVYQLVAQASQAFKTQDFGRTQFCLNKAAPLVSQINDTHWRIKSEFFKIKSTVAFYTENYNSAISDIKTALSIKSGYPISRIEKANDLNNLAFTYNGVDLPDSTEYYLEEAMDLMLTEVDSVSNNFIKLYTNYAYGILRQNDFERALTHYRTILRLSTNEQLDIPYQVFFCYQDIATIYASLLEDDLAIKYYEKALQFFKSKISEVDRELITIYESMVIFYIDRDLPHKAMEYAVEMERLAPLIYEEELNSGLGYALLSKAKVLYKQGEFTESEKVIQQLKLVWQDEYNNKKHSNWAFVNLISAQNALGLGQYNEALNLTKEAKSAMQGFWKINHRELVNSKLVEIEALIKLKDEQASAAAIASFENDYLPNGKIAYPNIQFSIASFLQLQMSHLQTFNDELGMSFPKFEIKINKVYYQSLASTGDQLTKLQITKSFKKLYDEAIKFCFTQFQNDGDEKWVEFGIQAMETSKNLRFRENLIRANLNNFKNVPSHILDTLGSFELKISKLKSSLDLENDILLRDDLLSRYERRKNEFDIFLQSLKQEFPDFFQLFYDAPTLDFAAMKKKLKDRGIDLVAFHYSNDNLYRVLLTSSQMKIDTINREKSNQYALEYLKTISSHESMDYIMNGQLIYDVIFQGIELSDDLMVLRDGMLAKIPFEAFVDDAEEFLLTNHRINYLNSLFELNHYSNERASQILAFVPGFFDEMKSTDSNNRFLPQPHAVKLGDKLKSKYSGLFLFDQQATDAAFVKQVQDYDVLHLTTHFKLDNKRPLQSELYFVPEESQQTDGILTLSELFAIPMNAKLAVLIACETGTGYYEEGEGLISLAKAFSFAGCPSSVMSLWEIDEKNSVQIIELFYDQLEKTKSTVSSLRNAKLEYLNSSHDDLQHPYYWSGITLLGPDMHIHLKTKIGGEAWLGFIASSLLLILFWFGFKKFRAT